MKARRASRSDLERDHGNGHPSFRATRGNSLSNISLLMVLRRTERDIPLMGFAQGSMMERAR
jgi:hypothetical protein